MSQLVNKKKMYAAVAVAFLFGLFIYGLNAILTPFIIAALLAYLGDPLVDRLEAMKLGRSLSVSIVFLVLILALIVFFLLLGPLLSDQIHQLVQKLPGWLTALEDAVLPYLREWGFLSSTELNQTAIKDAIANYWQEGGSFALNTVKKLGSSGAALLGFVTNVILIPVLTFYLLRDWDIMVAKFRSMIPLSSKQTVLSISQECDEVLSAFLRGQFIVMLSLAVIYSVGLGFIGLELALLIGTIAGLANIIPYMGFVIGIISALIAAWMQFHAWTPLLYVAIIFGVGQLLEGMLLTPSLVGDKIGLHPVAVIFALMAGAQLGGFVGLLVALPVAAMLMVLVRYFIQQYKVSDLYHGGLLNEMFAESTNDVQQTVAEVQMETPVITSSAVSFTEEDSVFDDAIWMRDVSEKPVNAGNNDDELA